MTDTEIAGELLPLFKALADPKRLKIVGLLSQRPHAVEELSATLRLGASTVSHHLAVLARAGLVASRAEGYYSIYSLRTAPLQEMSKRLLKREALHGLAGGAAAADGSGDAYDRKVLATFTDEEGRFKAFPMQEKKFLVLVRHVLRDFEHGVRYTEKKVNEMLARYSDDTARLRRALVEYRFMAREGGGGKYWRTDAPQ